MQNPSALDSKLRSLLAVSAGALVLPQAAEAAIIYSGSVDAKVGFSSGFNQSFTLDLPGTADLQLIRANGVIAYQGTQTNRVDFKQLNGYARIRAYNSASAKFARRNGAGPTWDAIPGTLNAMARIGSRTTLNNTPAVHGPGSFTDKYIAFEFQDSNADDALRYGWALMSMSVAGAPTASGPDVTLTSFAFDDAGAKIMMGAVPEPNAAALAAFGALALGGVRRWRAARQSS